MPMPIGGAFALHRGSGRSERTYEPDPELTEYREQQQYISENLKCTVKFFKSVIPPVKGTLAGIMVLEAAKTIEHSGIFMLMKGLPLGNDKKKHQATRKSVSGVKFTLLGSTYCGGGGEEGGEYMLIEGGSRETYPLEMEMPEELPQPLITSEGKLVYRMQVFLSTCEGRHVYVGEALIRWQGRRQLTAEEIQKPLKVEQEVTTKREYLGLLGRKKTAQMEWMIEKGGYLPGDLILVELWGETKDKPGLEVECKVELYQKVWYQVPSTTRGGRMWVKMKINPLSGGGSDEIIAVEGGGEEKKLLWRARLPVPRGITPTSKFDFTNSISYTIKASVGVAGESKDSWIMGEVPVLIGSSREEIQERVDSTKKEEDEDDEEEQEEDEEITSPNTPSPVPLEELERGRRGSAGSSGFRGRSQSMSFISGWMRPRAGSTTSMESCQSLASSTLSIFRLPPSYSQLSSRRPTLETLPPAYCDLALPGFSSGTEGAEGELPVSRPPSTTSLPPEMASGGIAPEEDG